MSGAQLATGSYLYTPSLDDQLTEAWERCGKSPAVLNGETLRSARRSVQLMLIDWTNRGIGLWQVQQIALSAVAGQPTLPLTAEIVDVVNMLVTDTTGTDRILAPIARDDYVALPLKTTTGLPTQYWVERILPSPVIHFYPAPDQAYTLQAWLLRQPADVFMGSTADVPLLWAEAMAAGLAYRLAVKFAPERAPALKIDAEAALSNARGENRERAPLTIMPMRYRR